MGAVRPPSPWSEACEVVADEGGGGSSVVVGHWQSWPWSVALPSSLRSVRGSDGAGP